jgi:hypothetical protein
LRLTGARPPRAADIQGLDNGDRGRAREGSRLSLNLGACPASLVQLPVLTRSEEWWIVDILGNLADSCREIFSCGRGKKRGICHDTKKKI